MRNLFNKRYCCVLVICFSARLLAQPLTPGEKRTDSIAQIAFRDLNNKNVDAIYALMGEDFKKRLSYSQFSNVFRGQLFPLTPFYNIIYKKTKEGIIKYQASSKDGLFQFLVGLDNENKLKTFSVNSYTDDEEGPDKYRRQEVMITMRDGIKLHTVIFTPNEQTGPLPFLLERTPYGVNGYRTP